MTGMLAIKDQKYSLEEYFELERTSEEKFEFWDGNVWCMSGASPMHERIVSNSIFHFRTILGRGCSVFGSNLKVKVPDYQPYRYPDLSVYCGDGVFETMGGLEVLTNPQLIIEVLSPSTEAFDRGEKFTYYKSIPSLTDYLLIASLRPHVTLFTKQSENEWVQREAVGLDEKLRIENFDIEILLSEIYLDIEFPDPPANLFPVDR
ncbi:MAG TPA: Uma2 family endonuclease [Pyrinomonadaceae bacterium]|nr:Uma2 family endonuclease [Pyrinomonadaceae bacterium]HMP66388.1 Uma2 family endonuclease [Pyrinomonadaceae bacterium]